MPHRREEIKAAWDKNEDKTSLSGHYAASTVTEEIQDMSANPYLAGLHLLKQHPGTKSQTCLAKCILSLYDTRHAFGIGEILSPLDSRYSKAVFDMLHAYAESGATEELKQAGEYVTAHFPMLVEQSNAMGEARRAAS